MGNKKINLYLPLIIYGIIVSIILIISSYIFYVYLEYNKTFKYDPSTGKVYINIDKMKCKVSEDLLNIICVRDNLYFRTYLKETTGDLNPSFFYIDICPKEKGNFDFVLLYNNLYLLEYGEKITTFSDINRSQMMRITEKRKREEPIPSFTEYLMDKLNPHCYYRLKNSIIIIKNLRISYNSSQLHPPGDENIVEGFNQSELQEFIKKNNVTLDFELYYLKK